MSMKKVYDRLHSFIDVMLFYEPATREKIALFQNENGIELPNSYVELLSLFDGGELFIPGTIIYGITPRANEKTIVDVNGRKARSITKLPNTYLIFGRLNYGDLICIDLNGNNEVIQWDHEQDEEFCRWNSIEEWLTDQIDDYIEYNDGGES